MYSIRTLCKYHPPLNLALGVTLPLPMLLPVITETYAAEPISAHSFISNANGYPILPKTTQSLVRGPLMAVPTISFVLSHSDTGLHAKEGGEAYR